MGEDWVTADLHLGNYGIIEHAARPFKHVRHMDSVLINNINDLVKPNDNLYILGDFSLASKSHKGMFVEWRRKIKCKYLHLIMGNHDIKDPTFYTDLGFMSFHYPYFKLDEFYMIHDPAASIVDKTKIFLCGHVHTIFKFKKNCINVGVDMWDYKPVSLTTIRQIVNDYSTMKIIGENRELTFPIDMDERLL